MVREAAAAVAQPLVIVGAVLAKLFDRGPAGVQIEAKRRIVDEVAAHTRGKAVLLASFTCDAAPSLRAASSRALRHRSFSELRTDRPTADFP